jgi:putative oxidoreductase
MATALGRLRARALGILSKLDFLPPLLARLTLGGVFLVTGWGKVNNLGKVAGLFADLHIPAPAFNAALVGWCELIGGALLLLGLLTRFATIPLMVTMIVALSTAKAPQIHAVRDLVTMFELTYLLLLLYLAIVGPGAASIDAAIARALEGPREPDVMPELPLELEEEVEERQVPAGGLRPRRA